MTSPTIAKRSKRAEELHDKCDLPRALMGGTAEMVEEGREFLPQHPAESDAAYEVRLKGTTLYNGFADTVKKMAGKVFAEPVEVNSDVPPQIEQLLANIDGAGRDITAFSLDAFKEALVDGISFILVDMPVVTAATDGELPTMADQQMQGARPYTVLVLAEDVLGWKSENIGGAQVLTEVRIFEEFTEEDPKDEWKEIKVEQVRLLRRGSFELHRKIQSGPDAGQWMLWDEGTTSLSFIPLVPVYTNRVGFFEGEPPLMPLAELNLEHWISSSEQRKSLTFARFAMLVLTGVDAKSSVDVGPDKVLKLPQGATASYAEPSGNGITAGRLDLEAIEKRMQSAGMTVRVQANGSTTATAAAIDSSEANAALMAAAVALQDSLNQVLQVIAAYLGLPDGGTVEVNTDFGQAEATGTSQELLQLYTSGVIDQATLIDELQRRGILNETIEANDVVEQSQQAAIDVAPVDQTATSDQTTQAPIDNTPLLVEALQAILDQGQASQDALLAKISELSQQQAPAQAAPVVNVPPVDLSAIITALQSMPAPVVNVAPPVVNVAPMDMTPISDAIRAIPAPIVNVAAPDVPVVNVAPPDQIVAPQGLRNVSFIRDASGKIAGATIQ